MVNSKVKEYILLAFALLVVFGVYLNTMHPAFKNNDSPETTAVAVTLGIGHPPGYPLYTIAGKIRTLIPAGNYAFRMNIFSSLLAVMTLLATYLILTRQVFKLFITEYTPGYWVLGFGSVFLLAFSRIFWNQALEAKGGIYMLNLFFLAVIIYLSLGLLQVFSPETGRGGRETKDPGLETEFKIRNLYSISFIFGLSLSNHWPSMIILAPVFAYLFFRSRKLLKPRQIAVCGLFLAAGLTPYLYLLIRANAGAVFNWGNPRDLQGLLWVILRQGYAVPVKAGADVYGYQAAEFLKLFVTNYSLFFLLAFAGGVALYQKAKKLFWFLAAIFVSVAVMVVFYNRTKQGVIYLLDIFLVPAEYICLLMISAGAAFAVALIKNIKKLSYAAGLAAVSLFVFMAASHYKLNNSDRDYLSYDFGYAILNTMEKGSVYLGDGDYNLMPVYYLQDVMNKRRDIIMVTDSFILFKWGIDDFVKTHGSVALKPFDAANSERKIIDYFSGARNIYRSNYFPRFDNYSLPYSQAQYGILTKISREAGQYGAGIFDLYSYRGIYDDFCVLNSANFDLTGWYAVSMVNQANALNQAGKAGEAIELYKKALNFPNEKPEANILYNAALAFEKLKDYDNELVYLKKAILKDGNMLAALERAGLICYEKGHYQQAKEYFDKAVLLGTINETVKKGSNILNSLSDTERLESMLIKANEYIEKQDLKKAMEIYVFLLEKRYKTAIIYRNLGVYHFRAGGYKNAIENFNRSNNETPSPEAYLYTAYAYYKQNMIKEAKKALNAGLGKFGKDIQLKDLYQQLNEQEKKNEKNSDSNHRQR